MRAICEANTGSALLAADGAPLPSEWEGILFSAATRFNVTVGQAYIVLGNGVFNSGLLLLVANDSLLPDWLPAGLFSIDDPRLPTHWEMAVFKQGLVGDAPERRGWQARWGYPDLVRSNEHCNGLEERIPQDLQVFHDQRIRETAAQDDNGEY